MWQIKWFRIGVLIALGLLAVGGFFIYLIIRENSRASSPTLPPKNTPAPSLQGYLPEPKTLGVATKNESLDPILMYHHIANLPKSANQTERELSLSTMKFEEELKYLSESGYQAAILSELFNDLPNKRVVLTFDDGYKDIIENAWPLMDKAGFRGVVFVIVNNVGKPGYLNWQDLEILRDRGWEIGSHSLTHPDLKREPESVQQKQIVESKKIIEEKLGIKVNYFCYPAGKYSQNTMDLLRQADYLGAVTTEPGTRNLKSDIFELKRIRINGSQSLSSFKNYFK